MPSARRRPGERTWDHPPFRRILVARAISGLGSYMQLVASGWLVFHLTGSAMAVGVLGLLALGPALVGSPTGGWLADRFCPRKLAVTLSALSAVGPGALTLIAFSGEPTVAQIYTFTLIGAIPNSIAAPIKAIVTPYSVPPALRRQAVSDVSAAYGVAQLLGSLIGGTLVQFAGPGWAYLVNAASEVLNAVVYRLSPVLQQACDRARETRTGGLWSGLKLAWAYDSVRIVGVGAVAFFALIGPLQALMPKLSAAHNDDPMLLGVLLASISVGSLLANPVIRRRLTDSRSATRLLVEGLIIASASTVGLSASGSMVLDCVFLIGVGIGWECVYVAGLSSLQLDIPADISGRTVGGAYLCIGCCLALGAVGVGWLFDTAGVGWSLAGIGVLGTAVGLDLYRRQRSATFMAPQQTLMDTSNS